MEEKKRKKERGQLDVLIERTKGFRGGRIEKVGFIIHVFVFIPLRTLPPSLKSRYSNPDQLPS